MPQAEPRDPRDMNPEELAATKSHLKNYLHALEAAEKEKDDQLVWIEQPNGRKELCRKFLWDRHLSRQQERGYRLLSPDEVEDEQAKVAQAAAARKERRKLWMKIPRSERGEFEARKPREKYSLAELRQILEDNGWQNRDQYDDWSLGQMQSKIAELEALLAKSPDPPQAEPEPEPDDDEEADEAA